MQKIFTQDLHLATLCDQGDQGAWTQLVTAHTKPLLRYAQGLNIRTLHAVRGMLAEDLLQEFWISLRNRIHRYNGTSPLGYWLKRELGARCGDLLRPKLRQGPLYQLTLDQERWYDQSATGDTPELTLVAHQAYVRWRQAWA